MVLLTKLLLSRRLQKKGEEANEYVEEMYISVMYEITRNEDININTTAIKSILLQ